MDVQCIYVIVHAWSCFWILKYNSRHSATVIGSVIIMLIDTLTSHSLFLSLLSRSETERVKQPELGLNEHSHIPIIVNPLNTPQLTYTLQEGGTWRRIEYEFQLPGHSPLLAISDLTQHDWWAGVSQPYWYNSSNFSVIDYKLNNEMRIKLHVVPHTWITMPATQSRGCLLLAFTCSYTFTYLVAPAH